MSRERFIAPQTWSSEQFCSVSFMADLLFIGVISTADDHGRRRGSAHTLLAEIFPNRGITHGQVLQYRSELHRAGLIQLYYDDCGGEVLSIPEGSWKKYQNPRYVSKSRFPEFPGAGEVCTDSVQTCAESEQVGTDSVQICCSGVVGRGVVGGGVQPPSPPSPLTLDGSVAATGLTGSDNGETAGKAHIAPLNGNNGKQRTATAIPPPSKAPPPEPPPDAPADPSTAERPSEPKAWMEVTKRTRECFNAWALQDLGEFRQKAALKRLIRERDAADAAELLAHVLAVDGLGAPESAMGVLYDRLRSGEPPPDDHVDEAKRDAKKHAKQAAAAAAALAEASKEVAADPGPHMELTPVIETTRTIVEGWLADAKFRKADRLRSLVRSHDQRDPVRLLAHIRECDQAGGSSPALLWNRLNGGKDDNGNPITPSDAAIAWAKAQILGDGPRGGEPEQAADVIEAIPKPSSPADNLQAKIDARHSPPEPAPEDGSCDPPEGAGSPPQRERQRLHDSGDTEIAAAVAQKFAGLTAGWSAPNDNNHDTEKRAVQTLLAGNAIRCLAYVDQVNNEAIIASKDPWVECARMCRELPDPKPKCHDKAIEIVRELNRVPPTGST